MLGVGAGSAERLAAHTARALHQNAFGIPRTYGIAAAEGPGENDNPGAFLPSHNVRTHLGR